MKRLRMLASSVVCLLAAHTAPSLAAAISYPDFSSTAGLTLNGNAAVVGNALRVTPSLPWQAGSAFSTDKVALTDGASFSTYFQFQFSNPQGRDSFGLGADGLVFVVQTVSNNVGATGGGIGYQGIANSIGIEFDTWNNGSGDGGSSNHIGINVGGDINSVQLAEVTEADMNAGDVWNAWVDYNSVTGALEARLSRTALRPTMAMLTHTIDLAATLGATDAFVGFTSGTGAAQANHDVLSWTLEDRFAPIDPGTPGQVPEPMSLLLGASALGLMAVARRQRRA